MTARRYIKIIVISTALGCVTAADAGEMGREEVISEILQNNPRLKALETSQKSQSALLRNAGRLSSQPEVEFEHLWGTDDAKKWNIGLTQSFDWPGVYSKRGNEAEARIDAFRYLYAVEVRGVALEVRLLLANAIYINKQLQLVSEISKNLSELKASVDMAYKRGQLTVLDVKKLDFEMYSVSARQGDLLEEQDKVMGQLEALNGGKPINADISAYVPEKLLDIDAYLAAAVENNPSVKAADRNAQAARIASGVAKAERLPGFSVGYRHAFEENTHFNGFSVSMTLPVFTNKAASVAADIEARSLDFEATTAAVSAQSKVRATYNDAVRRGNAMKGMSAVVLDDTYPGLLMMAYKGGQINVITYLQEINYFQNARTEYLAAEYSYIVDLNELNSNMDQYGL